MPLGAGILGDNGATWETNWVMDFKARGSQTHGCQTSAMIGRRGSLWTGHATKTRPTVARSGARSASCTRRVASSSRIPGCRERVTARSGIQGARDHQFRIRLVQGRADGGMSRDRVASAPGGIVAATDVPVNADFESGYAHDPAGFAQMSAWPPSRPGSPGCPSRIRPVLLKVLSTMWAWPSRGSVPRGVQSDTGWQRHAAGGTRRVLSCRSSRSNGERLRDCAPMRARVLIASTPGYSHPRRYCRGCRSGRAQAREPLAWMGDRTDDAATGLRSSACGR